MDNMAAGRNTAIEAVKMETEEEATAIAITEEDKNNKILLTLPDKVILRSIKPTPLMPQGLKGATNAAHHIAQVNK